MALKYLLPGQMKFMKQNGFEVLMVSADGKERMDVIKNEECPHIIVPMTRQITPVSDIKSLWQLYRVFRREKPDIIHSHTPKAGLLAMMAGKLAGVKIRIHTVAGLRFMTAKGKTRKLLVSMEKFTAAAATHVWPNSLSLKNYILTNKLASPEKVQMIGFGSSNGIDLNRFSASVLDGGKLQVAKQQIQYDPSNIYLLSIGRIVRDKGMDELLKAFAAVYADKSNLRLVILGSFEDELDPVSEEARNILKTHPGIIHIQWSDEVENFLSICNMLVHPSYREGFPNVLLQAGALDCPILCSRIEGNVDIVDHKETGLLFEVRDAKGLEEQLRFALDHPGELKTYAANLKKRIQERFDRRFVHESIKNKYLEILSGK